MKKKPETKFIFAILPLLLLGSYSPLTFAGTSEYITDAKTGCKIYDLDDAKESAIWSGACVGGKISGNGTLTTTNKNNNVTCENKGEMKEGLRTGHNVANCSDGTHFEGEYKPVAGVVNGKGSLNLPNGDKYVGEVKGWILHGQGTYTLANGKSVSGTFENNKYIPKEANAKTANKDSVKDSFELMDKGMKLFDSDQYEESLVSFDQFLTHFEQFSAEIKQSPGAQDIVSAVIYTQGGIFLKQGKTNKAVAKWDENQQRFGQSTDPKVKETLAHGAAAKEMILTNRANKGQNEAAIYPKEIFDVAQARNAMEAGNVTVKGRVCAFYDGRVFSQAGVKVNLLPVTPYLEAWKKLRDSKKGKNVTMSEEAISIRNETKTVDNGYYSFSNVKPGKYFMQATMEFVQAKSNTVYDGSDTYGNTTTNYYHEEAYGVERGVLLEETVDITKDGEVKTVNLYKGSWLNRAVNIECR
jgi:hypothetical protein